MLFLLSMFKKFPLFLVLSVITLNANAFDWTSNDIQLLYGDTFKLGDKSRTTITVEHSNGWKYGSNFFFVDIVNRNDMSTEFYLSLIHI